MAICKAGKQFTADELQETAGKHRQSFCRWIFCLQGDQFPRPARRCRDAHLITLGLAQEEINAIKVLLRGDLPPLKTQFALSTWV